jgi:hypothetical protein
VVFHTPDLSLHLTYFVSDRKNLRLPPRFCSFSRLGHYFSMEYARCSVATSRLISGPPSSFHGVPPRNRWTTMAMITPRSCGDCAYPQRRCQDAHDPCQWPPTESVLDRESRMSQKNALCLLLLTTELHNFIPCFRRS